jgi:hypothetical protein
MFNVETPFTVPRLVNLSIHAITKAWDEGNGVDLDEYKDEGAPGDGTHTGDTDCTGTGSSWQVASEGASWTTEGGDYGPSLGLQFLDDGTEDIEVDITTQVEAWIADPSTNYGLLVKLEDDETAITSAYDKKFSGRGSEYFFKRPYIEARWPDYEIDDRDNFYSASPLVANETNTIFLKNYFDGQLADLPGASIPSDILFYSTEIFPTLEVSAFALTGGDIRFDLSITGGPVVILNEGTDFIEGTTAAETASAIVRAVKLNEQLAAYIIADNRRGRDSTITFREGPNKFLTFKQDIIRGPANFITYNDQPFEVPIGLQIDVSSEPNLNFVPALVDYDSATITANPDGKVGVYQADITNLNTNEDLVYAVWAVDPNPWIFTIVHKEFIEVKHRIPAETSDTTFVTNVTNLKSVYSTEEQARFRLFIRSKDWSPTIYTVATKRLRTQVVEKAYFRITRIVDDLPVIDWGIEDTEHTRISYDELGAFFDLDLALFEPGWAYRIELAYEVKGELKVQPESFKFRVE